MDGVKKSGRGLLGWLVAVWVAWFVGGAAAPVMRADATKVLAERGPSGLRNRYFRPNRCFFTDRHSFMVGWPKLDDAEIFFALPRADLRGAKADHETCNSYITTRHRDLGDDRIDGIGDCIFTAVDCVPL